LEFGSLTAKRKTGQKAIVMIEALLQSRLTWLPFEIPLLLG